VAVSSGAERETFTLLGPLERANLNHWAVCCLVFRIPDDGHGPKPSDSEGYLPWSENVAKQRVFCVVTGLGLCADVTVSAGKIDGKFKLRAH
jgi:hypothetical protein